MKIWNWGVENYHNFHKLQFESFHFSYDNIIIDHGKKKTLKIHNFFYK
jgi:hypothetical protein